MGSGTSANRKCLPQTKKAPADREADGGYLFRHWGLSRGIAVIPRGAIIAPGRLSDKRIERHLIAGLVDVDPGRDMALEHLVSRIAPAGRSDGAVIEVAAGHCGKSGNGTVWPPMSWVLSVRNSIIPPRTKL